MAGTPNRLSGSFLIKIRVTLFCLASPILMACVLNSYEPLKSVDTRYTLLELSAMRMNFFFNCANIDPNTLEQISGNPENQVDGEKCLKDAETMYPAPDSIKASEASDYCRARAGFSNKEGTDEQYARQFECLIHIGKYRPMIYD